MSIPTMAAPRTQAPGAGVPPATRYVEQVMGMPVSLALRGRHADGARARAAWADLVTSLRHVDAVFSTYRADSWVSRLARCEVDVVDCPPEVAEVLALGERAREESGGAFDVTWTDAAGRTVLDPSGVVKGWAVERATAHLAGLADTDWCLGAGGDLQCHVVDPDGAPWRIGIEHPHDPSRVVAVVPVRRGAVATSGPAHRGAHLVDPRRAPGQTPPAPVLASVTVVGDCLTWVDVDATAGFVLGHDARDWLVARGRSGVLVHADGRAEVYAPRMSKAHSTVEE